MSGNKIGHDELFRFIHDVLVVHGASDNDAGMVAQGLVWANLRGVDGHGVSRLPRYLKFIASGEIDPKAQPRLIHDRAATFVLDGGHGFGPVAAMAGRGDCRGAGEKGRRVLRSRPSDHPYRRDRALRPVDRGTAVAPPSSLARDKP